MLTLVWQPLVLGFLGRHESSADPDGASSEHECGGDTTAVVYATCGYDLYRLAS